MADAGDLRRIAKDEELDGLSLPISTSAPNHNGGSPTSVTATSAVDGEQQAPQRTKPKQRRNKPTLSCLECVERKTKCDRARPCLACVKRQSECEYTAVATLIASADRKNGGSKARYVTKPSSKIRKASTASTTLTSPTVAANGLGPSIDRPPRPTQGASQGASPFLVSNIPFTQSSPSNVFGVGSQHPFSNYWTCQGGLPEVISVLPSKDQADLLIAKFFEVVDPVYPFIHRRTFYSDYENFWALPSEAKGDVDASLIALHFAMYALGTQFMTFSYEERSQTAEFYCSAANQALRVYSYLNRTSIRAIQAMLLIAYFLMNDNHASDAYAWAGIHLRQAYAMRLHRDPELVVPEASILEKQQRRKLWQAVFFQDTSAATLLKMPPTTTHSDVPVESLSDDNEQSNEGLESSFCTHSRVENLMSINAIAPQLSEQLAPAQPHHLVDLASMKQDVSYMRAMWHLGNLVQENLSSPMSLSLPVANSPRHKESLVAAFRRLYKSFPAYLTVLDHGILQQQVASNPRAVRQNLFLTSNYYHCLALLQASDNAAQEVEVNVKGALEAAHEALCAFFKLFGLFEIEAGVWWEYQHRAFEESLLIVNLLAMNTISDADYDKIFRDDIRRMLELMSRYGGNVEIHKTRQGVLREAFERLTS
ncbi:Zn(II)2Cys6 transcription factor like protein [Zymoseptoria brevis]|uniref:Zn(II)2Cys6 transcription factor like protein n=1 Tax=Zymoseptoria brevis TaxID=1047168 RepID=A0A0F4GRS7_9PEZI|nr:Zn(II)2Cys6 transcription factor like protein [Zymoseptoria brevis]